MRLHADNCRSATATISAASKIIATTSNLCGSLVTATTCSGIEVNDCITLCATKIRMAGETVGPEREA